MKGIKKKKAKKPVQSMSITKEASSNTIKLEILLHVGFSVLDFIEMEASRQDKETTFEVRKYRYLLEQFKTEMVDKSEKAEEIYDIGEQVEDFREAEMPNISDIGWFLAVNKATAIVFGRLKPIYRQWRLMAIQKQASKLPKSLRSSYITESMERYEEALKQMTAILHKLSGTGSKAKQAKALLGFLDKEIQVEFRK